MDRILLVDDDQDLLMCIKEFLELNGFEVISCSNSTDATAYFNQPHSDIKLVLSDIKMPHKDGLQLFEDFKQSPMGQEKVPYVLMTGHLDIIGVENAYKLGVDELVAKPFDLDTLRLVINYLLEKDQAFGESNDKYFPVRVEDFLHSRNNSFNLYIKVNDKYVLITKSGQEFTQQRLAHFASKGLQLVYLNNEHFVRYTDMQFLIAKQLSQRPLDAARKAKIMTQLVGSVSKGVLANHINKETFGHALTSFEAFTQMSLQHSQIEKILTQMIQSSGDLSERCSQTALLSALGMGFPQKLNRTKVHSYSKIVHCVIEFLETLYFQADQNDIQAALDQMYNTQTKFISLQVLKTLYKVFNAQMPKGLTELPLPNETLRVA